MLIRPSTSLVTVSRDWLARSGGPRLAGGGTGGLEHGCITTKMQGIASIRTAARAADASAGGSDDIDGIPLAAPVIQVVLSDTVQTGLR